MGADDLYANHPRRRLAAAGSLSRRARAKATAEVVGWPDSSPGARNAWLLFVTTKPPSWRDPLLAFPSDPLTLGEPHPGFFYPDPLGFWPEVRRWSMTLLRRWDGGLDVSDCVTLTTLVHIGEDVDRLRLAVATCRPGVVVFLDEPAWQASGWEADTVGMTPHHIPDPHRKGKVYQGFWARTSDGTIVAKAPQHPSTHRLYRADDMDTFLAACPSSLTF